ncbi:MAG: hypothetical protein PVS3B1_05000 [Ktedonobacteraceae bacterium]
MLEERYTSGQYFARWPTWHVESSSWNARQIERMLSRSTITPKTICDVGCGAGEVLKQLQTFMPGDCTCWGYEISPQAFELAKSRENGRLHFALMDFRQEKDVFFDLILLIDVIEHVEDCFGFLRAIKSKSSYKILHIPLDLSARTIIRDGLTHVREQHGHVHYFTKETALQTLKDVGYEVLDYFYTSPSLDLPTNGMANEMRRRLMTVPRKLFFTLNKEAAVRVLGGWSLMVLVK